MNVVRIVRRRLPVFAAVSLATIVIYLVAFGIGPARSLSVVAVSKVFITPDRPLPPVGGVLVSPPYLTFNNKLQTLTQDAILQRAALLIAGETDFITPEASESPTKETIETGRETVRTRHGGSIDTELLVDELRGSVWTRHVERQQIVEVHSRGPSPVEARLFSCAVAEAASQYHFTRAQRTSRRLLDELAPRIEEAELELGELSSALGSTARLNLTARSLLTAYQALEQEETEREVRSRKNQYQLQQVSTGPVQTERVASSRLTKIDDLLGRAHLELEVLGQSLSAKHPRLRDLRDLVDRLMRQRAELRDSEVSRQRVGVARALMREQQEIQAERALRKERMLEVSAALKANSAAQSEAELEEGRAQLTQDQITDLRMLEHDLHMHLVGHTSTVVPYAFAARTHAAGAPSDRGTLFAVFVIAMVLGLGAVVALEHYDRSVRNAHDVSGRLGLPLLGVVPHELEQLPQAMDSIATVVLSQTKERRRSLMVCSTLPGEGKTTVATELALSMARRGSRVVIVDADRHAPTVLDGLRGRGISTAASAPGPFGTPQASESSAGSGGQSWLQETSDPNLSVWTCPSTHAVGHTTSPSTDAVEIVQSLETEFDFVIADTAPLSLFGDALAVGAAVGGVLLVTSAKGTPRDQVVETRRQLEMVGAPILGAVLNHFPGHASGAMQHVGSTAAPG